METVQIRGKKFRVFHFDTPFGHQRLVCLPCNYCGNDTLAIRILSFSEDLTDFEPYSTLTVNLDPYTGAGVQSDTLAYVDTNNNGSWDCLRFIRENSLAVPTGIISQSGFCYYPLYRFDLSKFTA